MPDDTQYEDRREDSHSNDNDELYSRLGSIESKVDILLTDRPGVYRRVGKLERDSAWVKGAAAVMSFVAGFVGWVLSRSGIL